jgi:hypothetical protein
VVLSLEPLGFDSGDVVGLAGLATREHVKVCPEAPNASNPGKAPLIPQTNVIGHHVPDIYTGCPRQAKKSDCETITRTWIARYIEGSYSGVYQSRVHHVVLRF